MKKSHKFDLVYDVRVLEKCVREGVISKKDYGKFLKSLEDVEDKGEPLVLEDETEGEEDLEAAAEGESAEEEEKEE
ncbi:MAG: hypothetical protein IH874_00235 [Candidatus Dadabacteria bacterium]|nr:hypothetical protein [Candidatus Dadabacteria bacterium]